jgi:NAD(P)H-hydrate repair Nnr-like enzyme with NAD(P)H-hydrate dehydratase domain
LVLRICRALSDNAVADLNQKFAGLVRTGEIIQRDALPQEKNEPEIAHLPRLVLTPHRRDFGRFRQLIDAINASSVR